MCCMHDYTKNNIFLPCNVLQKKNPICIRKSKPPIGRCQPLNCSPFNEFLYPRRFQMVCLYHMFEWKMEKNCISGTFGKALNGRKSALSTQIDKWYPFRKAYDKNMCVLVCVRGMRAFVSIQSTQMVGVCVESHLLAR